ncbi:MAG: beta-propeller repeat protein [Chthonomonadaceae bacterium]|nr:beta-propeller repeat protein [Chthonomonadaceae bacterium]
MKWKIGFALAAIALGATGLYAEQKREMEATAKARTDLPRVTADGVLLPTGWVLHPAGRQIPTGDMPLAMIWSPEKDYLLVTTGGYAPSRVLAIDTFDEQLQTSITLDQTWEGMTFSADGKELFVSGGGRGLLWRFGFDTRGGDMIRKEPLPVANLIGRNPPYVRQQPANANAWIGGLATDPTDGTLYALNTARATLYALDPTTGAAKAQARTGDHPNAVALSPDYKTVAVTNQGGASVSLYAAGTLSKIMDIPVGQQPVALLFAPDGRRLYVANSGSNTVSVIDTAAHTVRENIRTSLFPKSPTGSTPNALALAPDGKRLFVTNADNNDVAVIDVSMEESKVVGFIPTGWYPTTVAVSPDGKRLFVGVGKGLGSKPSFPRAGGGVGLNIYNKPGQSYGPQHDQVVTFDYICSLLSGSISIVDMPDDKQLARYTAQVIAGCPYRDEWLTQTAEHGPACLAAARLPETNPGKAAAPPAENEKSKIGAVPIQHVLYIIKENRTYDQIFGDMKEGNGDPDLVLFGENVTPNHHALAREFVLLDNLYCNGEVSEDGHQWCNAAFCTDWTQKVYPGNYATPSRGDAPGSEAVTASTGGYLWDNCASHGLTYRTYGEFTSFHSDKDSPPVATSGSPNLRGHVSLAWELAARQGKRRDYQRADAFLEELAAAEKTGDWPNYMVMSLGEDHTVGLTPGAATPWAAVASNDLALGRIVEGVSHSRFWGSTAIFVIEDDAQAGPDHVDAHRTAGLVISPYVRRHNVDHTLYTTASFIRTMELALGLPPMTQYDAAATPLFRSFTDKASRTPYTVIPPRTDLAATNPKKGQAATVSLGLDFSGYDRCDPNVLNRLLWHAIKGNASIYPAPTTGARLAAASR